MMLALIISLSVVFFGIGRMLTVNNAKYYLSGYNTLSEADQQNFDLVGYLSLYKSFHLFLSISFLVIGLLLYAFKATVLLTTFVGLYPILAYVYFIWKSHRYAVKKQSKAIAIALVLLLSTGIIVGVMIFQTASENKLIVTQTGIEITGMYGEVIPFSNIDTVDLINQLPEIKRKSNGFAVPPIFKGYFRMETGERVKLMINANQKPMIRLVLLDGSKIFYSAKEDSNTAIYQQILDSKSH